MKKKKETNNMCNKKIQITYDILNCVKVDEINNKIDNQLQATLDFLATLPASEIPHINPFLQLWIERQLSDNNNIDEQIIGRKVKQEIADNLHNFSLAKQSKLLEGYRFIEKQGLDNARELKGNFASVMFNTHMDTENLHVNKNTKVLNTVIANDDKLLEYISERDSKVRAEHEKADGTILPQSDPFWDTAFGLLGEWNCRCIISVAREGAEMTKTPKVTVKTGDESPSDIDLENGKAMLFKKELDVFSDAPVVVRRQYRKNGF